MSESFLIVGAGGHAKVVIDALHSSGSSVSGCYDDNPSIVGSEPVAGVRVIGGISLVERDWRKGAYVIVAIGDNLVRRRISLCLSVEYGIARAPSAVLGKDVRVEYGAMILPSATINILTVVGKHVILNTSCSVDHDCQIGDFAHIAPGCTLGGNVTVGEGTFLGLGSRVIPNVHIGCWSVIGAGAVVTRDLPDNCTAVGVPARVIKKREEGWHLR